MNMAILKWDESNIMRSEREKNLNESLDYDEKKKISQERRLNIIQLCSYSVRGQIAYLLRQDKNSDDDSVYSYQRL